MKRINHCCSRHSQHVSENLFLVLRLKVSHLLLLVLLLLPSNYPMIVPFQHTFDFSFYQIDFTQSKEKERRGKNEGEITMRTNLEKHMRIPRIQPTRTQIKVLL